jgi:multidrug transporter EmrE-like cation transporter
LSCGKYANTNIRRLLRKNKSDGSHGVLPRRTQVILWQLSVQLLVMSVMTMTVGMFILIWSATGGPKVRFGGWDWWNNEAKLAVTFSTIAFVVGGLFVWEQIELYTWNGADDTGQC